LRVSSLYRFQGSPALFRDPSRASLDRITKQKAFVKHFLEVFSEKNKADQYLRTMVDPPGGMFGFWPGLSFFLPHNVQGFFVPENIRRH